MANKKLRRVCRNRLLADGFPVDRLKTPPTDEEIYRVCDERSPQAAIDWQIAAGVPIREVTAPKSAWIEWAKSRGLRVPPEWLH